MPSGPPTEARSVTGGAYPSLVFVAIPEPAALKDRQQNRTIRSHAVSIALARKRCEAQQHGENFREVTAGRGQSIKRASNRTKSLTKDVTAPSGYLGNASIDPFETLAVDARRLTALFHLKTSVSAGEPVLNVNDAIHFQSLQSVFQTGLTDGALAAALGLAMCHAASGWNFNDECAKFSSIALQQIHNNLADYDLAVAPSTIGSILLLLGIEYRLEARQQAQTHLDGIRVLIDLCAKRNIQLTVPLRRAIYWQDLFSSIFVHTNRIVSYGDFHPGMDAPKLPLSSNGVIPEGFSRNAARLGHPFMSIVSDVVALYRGRPNWLILYSDEEGLQRLCNTQADLEGRLQDLLESSSDDMLRSCILATFLCVYGLWTDMWNSALIPRRFSTQLLHHVRCWRQTGIDNDDELLFWILHVGKAFAVDAEIRRGLDEVSRNTQNGVTDLSMSGEAAMMILYDFMWSDVFYSPKSGWLWERIDHGV